MISRVAAKKRLLAVGKAVGRQVLADAQRLEGNWQQIAVGTGLTGTLKEEGVPTLSSAPLPPNPLSKQCHGSRFRKGGSSKDCDMGRLSLSSEHL